MKYCLITIDVEVESDKELNELITEFIESLDSVEDREYEIKSAQY